MRIKNAFSFAEVLVTLMIIGVIAAMTIPALRKDSMNKTITTNLKKIYSEMNQATSLALTNNNTNRMYRTGLLDSDEIYETEFIKKYFNVSVECPAGNAKSCFGVKTKENLLNDSNKSYLLANGIAVQFHYNSEMKTYKDLQLNIAVDVNGPKSPNKGGADQFMMYMNGLGNVHVGSSNGNDNRISTFDENCSGDNTSDYNMAWACAAKIQLDGWEIKY